MNAPATHRHVRRPNVALIVALGAIAAILLTVAVLTLTSTLDGKQRSVDLPAASRESTSFEQMRFIEENTWQIPYHPPVLSTDEIRFLEENTLGYHEPGASYLMNDDLDECPPPAWLGPDYVAMDQFRCIDW